MTSEDFNQEALKIAERFLGTLLTPFGEASIKAAFQELVYRFYATGGYLCDLLAVPILDVEDVVITVDRHSHQVSVVADRRRKEITLSEVLPSIITPEIFQLATGRLPQHDDLERANCLMVGNVGHFCCGWNIELNKPRWECL